MGNEKVSWSEAIEISQEIARKAEAERGEEGVAMNEHDAETIEALRQRVAELEEKIGHYDTAEYHLSQMVKSLTAENAELKRQVEALREDAEVGRDAIEAMAITDTLRRIDEGWSVEILNDNPDPETKDVQCGVVVHSDFGMTQDQYLGETVLDALRKALKSTVEALREAAKTGE